MLSDEQSAIVGRVLELGTRSVADEMVSWDQVTTIGIDDPPQVMWDLANRTSHARFPVTDTTGAVRGVVSVYDCLIHKQASCPPLRHLMTPATTLDINTPLRAALTQLQTQHAALAVVTSQGKPVGVATVKDLVEPITGELASW